MPHMRGLLAVGASCGVTVRSQTAVLCGGGRGMASISLAGHLWLPWAATDVCMRTAHCRRSCVRDCVRHTPSWVPRDVLVGNATSYHSRLVPRRLRVCAAYCRGVSGFLFRVACVCAQGHASLCVSRAILAGNSQHQQSQL